MLALVAGLSGLGWFARPTDHPGMGAVCQYLWVGRQDVPGYVIMPAYPGYSQGLRRAGPYGGYLGSRYNPLFAACEPQYRRPVSGENSDFYDHTLTPMGEPRDSIGRNHHIEAYSMWMAGE